MLTYSFEGIGNETLYEHLYKSIKEDIRSGTLRARDRLPSKRAFARQLSISTITVENAYAQLLTEGYIESKPRMGYFVADIKNGADLPLTDVPSAQQKNSEKQSVAPVPPRRVYFADFASNQTDPDSFPFSNWAKISRQVLSDRQTELMTNPPSGGVRELRIAIADYLREFRGLDVDAQQVIIGAGTEYLYGLLIQLLGQDLTYACEDPGYRKVSQIYAINRLDWQPVPMDEQGMRIDYLRDHEIHVAHVTPSHHFPTGIIMPASRRYELLRWAEEGENRYIIEDDYDSEFRMTGRVLPALMSIDGAERVIYVNTFTKSLASTIRVSYMVLPPHLLERYREKMGFYSGTVSTFEQYTLAEFIRRGYYEKHINRMRNMNRKRRDLLLSEIAGSPLGGRVRISEENAGLHFLMQLPGEVNAQRFREELDAEEIRMAEIRTYALTGQGGDGRTFVVNYSSVPTERIPEAVRRICEAAETAQECGLE